MDVFPAVDQLKKDLLSQALMRITVVLPTYNEAENLPKLVSALLSLPLDLTRACG